VLRLVEFVDHGQATNCRAQPTMATDSALVRSIDELRLSPERAVYGFRS
jgi:hypothetical protein